MNKLTRRTALGAALASPFIIRRASAAGVIKIGMPLALTGPLGIVGEQMRRGALLWQKTVNAQGGLIGRPIELLISDTGGDPATCVRKAQECVERAGCRILFGMTLSSEALAVVTVMPVVARDLGGLRLYGWVFSGFLASTFSTIAACRSFGARS